MGPFAPKLPELEENANIDREDENRKRKFYKLSKVEASLARARTAIRKAAMYGNHTPIEDADYTPWGPIYRNPFKFHRSYIEMEKTFKIYVYKEGEPPLVHDGPCRSIYSTEGRFIHEMDKGNRFVTNDPEEAHAFFLPFSIVKMVRFIFIRHRRDAQPIMRFVADYIDVISKKHGYWERNRGADHFMVSCHDWGPMSSKASDYLYNNSIRVLCNANTSEGFNPAKDASLPEINMRTHDLTDKFVGGPSPSRRPILAFFAGGMHGPIRPALLEHWKGKDADVQVYEYLPKKIDYYQLMKKSRYCLCPSGYEVASPRIVEAIYLGCVPVILKEGYVLPFSDVLNWKAFSVTVPVSEIKNLKKILMGISTRRYLTMQRRVKLVRRHFLVNNPPKRYDIFHMILHSVWLRRLNQRPHVNFKNRSRF
ncbi:unnamed protein product [Victoria cruziana]